MLNFAEIELLKTSIWLEKATKEERAQAKFRESVTRMLTKEWDAHAKRALTAGLAAFDGKTTKRQAAEIIAAVESELKGFGDKSLPTVEKQTEALYEAQVSMFLSKFGLKVQKATATGPRASLAVNFTQKDKDAIKMLNSFTNISAGRLFPEQVMGKVAEVTSMIVLEEGQSTEVAAAELEKRLAEELTGALGLDVGSLIPDAFATNPEAYFEVLANNAAVMGQNSGRLIGMEDAGVKFYRVAAVRDERTSEICKNMDGRVIEVKSGMGMLNQMLDLSSPTALAELFPWDSARGNLGPNTLENNNKLATGGLGFPPYHGNCRTTVVPEM